MKDYSRQYNYFVDITYCALIEFENKNKNHKHECKQVLVIGLSEDYI